MSQNIKAILSLIISFVLVVAVYYLSGMDDKYIETESFTVPFLFGIGGFVLYLALFFLWVKRK